MAFQWSIISIAALAVGSAAMAAEPAASDEARLKESLAKWEKTKQEVGGDYSYVVRWSSFVGFGHATTVTVRKNKVVERKYEEFTRPMPVKPGEQPAAPKPKWVEAGKELGDHKTEGAPGRTLDELYSEAAKILSAEVPAGHRRLLGFDKQGLLCYCFDVDTRIADDAPRTGISPFQLQLPPQK